MSRPLDRFLAGRGLERTPGKHNYALRCGAHDDQHESLSVSESDDGNLLVKCHAGDGCSHEAIMAAEGLTVADMFAAKRAASSTGPVPRIVSTYDYVDADGALLCQVVRYEPKDFRQRRPDGRGGWTWNLHGVPRVPYRLPELIADVKAGRRIYLVEGEKDAEALRALGLTASCNPGGAGKNLECFDGYLDAARVTILPDNDKSGRRHAHELALRLRGVKTEVRVVELAGLPEKGDVSDWLNAGGNAEELERLASTAAKEPSVIHVGGFRTMTMGELLSLELDEAEYVVAGMLPAGGLSLLVAKPKAGKSTLARCLALLVARGDEFLGRACAPGPVLYAALEEPQATVQRHFRKMGARDDDLVYLTTGPTPRDAVAALGKAVEKVGAVLVIVDPIVLLTRVKDMSAYAEVYTALEPVIEMARASGAHVMLLHHSSKIERSGVDSPLGSTALGGAVDTLLHLRRREDNTRLLATVQRNGEDMPETVLAMDADTGAVAAGGVYSEIRLDQTIAAMRAVLEASDEPLTRDELFGRVEAAGKLKADALKHLREADALRVEGGGKRSDPNRYTLATADKESDHTAPVSCSDNVSAPADECFESEPQSLFSRSHHVARTREQETGDGIASDLWDDHPSLPAA